MLTAPVSACTAERTPGSSIKMCIRDSDKEVAEDTMTPKILITDYEAPDSVQYGEEFKVTIKFMNNSKKKAIENMSMTITPPEGVSIVNGTNKRHYITIPQRQSTTETRCV